MIWLMQAVSPNTVHQKCTK